MELLHSNRPPDKSAYLKIVFLIPQPKQMLWVLKTNVSMFKLIDKKIIAIVRIFFFCLTGPMSKMQLHMINRVIAYRYLRNESFIVVLEGSDKAQLSLGCAYLYTSK